MRKKKKKRRYVTYGVQARRKPRLTMRLIGKWSVIVFILIATAVAYVWQKNTIISLGYRINELRKGISTAGTEELKLRATLVRLQRPQRLWAEIRERELGLEEPSPKQKITLAAPRPFRLPVAKRGTARSAPAVSATVARISVRRPHPENPPSRRRR